MKRSILFFIFFFDVHHYGVKAVDTFLGSVDPDVLRNVSEFITDYGYPLEEHSVTTQDGYILSIQRIPYGKNNNTDRGDKKVVLLVHGELGDGKTWFLNPPGQGLGYFLPDEDCDVWILNCRGSTYSQKHVIYPVRSLQFWDWSFDEVAKYDLTAAIDHILQHTGKRNLSLVGYSRGNTVTFILLSELPEYNKKINLFVALAPVAYVGHMTSIVALAALPPISEGIVVFIKAAFQGEFIPFNNFTKIVTAKFCEAFVDVCSGVIFAVGGVDKEQLNRTRVPIYSAQYPSSTSVKIIYQYAQLFRSHKFQKFDNGLLGNLKEYNQPTPPDYQVSRITSPVALFSSDNDLIGNPTDVDILRRQLNSVVFRYNDQQYSHLDFIWGKDAQERIYKPLVQLLSQY